MENSGFRKIAIGVAVEHLKEGSLDLKVHLSEIFADESFEFTDEKDNTKEKQSFGISYSGDKIHSVVKRGTTITCKYYNKGSNILTPPMVRRGETIEVYQYGDSDRYYWRTPFYETSLRGLETLTMVLSNLDRDNPTNHLKKVDKENSYWITLSTLQKLTHFHTNKNDKEPLTWDFKLDTKEGNFKVWNDGYVSTYMDGELYRIKAKKIVLEADEIIINGKKYISSSAPTINIKADNTNISGGNLNNNSKLNQTGSSEFKASVKCNKNCSVIKHSTVA